MPPPVWWRHAVVAIAAPISMCRVSAPYRHITELPYNRQPNMPPALSDSEVDDVVQFLGTLTDGYTAQ
ncbi:hypothetical protein [Collimonas silvisoli]|uniref:hypothetical protein n=1 Tax=Collimonas silvisoli TaxID=2825884 RepID=UPI001B8BC8CA|nr:hypothetical protein [Collimonas silvisoli]